MSDWFKGKTYLDPDMTQDNGGEWEHIEDVSALLSEVRVANEAFEESDAACADLEDAMRDIKAATSDEVKTLKYNIYYYKEMLEEIQRVLGWKMAKDFVSTTGRKCEYERNQ